MLDHFVDRQHKVKSVGRLNPPFDARGDSPARRVPFLDDHAVLPLKVLVKLPFQPLETLVVDARKSDELRREGAVGVKAEGALLNTDPREVQSPDGIGLLGREAKFQPLDGSRRFRRFSISSTGRLRMGASFCAASSGFSTSTGIVVRCFETHAGREDVHVAVVDHASLRQERDRPEPLLEGQRREAVCLDDL